MTANERQAYWYGQLQGALGPLHPEQLEVAAAASIEAERAGAGPDDSLWAGKAAASKWEDDRSPALPSPEEDDFEVVAIVDLSAARVLKASLETAGIPALLRQASELSIGLVVGAEAEVSVLVPPDRVAEARDLLDAPSSGGLPARD